MAGIRRWCVAAGLAAVTCIGAVWSQLIVPRPEDQALNITLPVSPQLSFVLQTAERAIADQDWNRAIDLLQQVLDAPEDAFLGYDEPSSGQGRAAELLVSLPTAGRQQYERRYTAAAEALLAQADRSGSLEPLGELARRFPLTEPGRTALWRLAIVRQDQGESLSAARLFDALLLDSVAAKAWGGQLLLRSAAVWLAAGDEAIATERLERLANSPTETVPGPAGPRSIGKGQTVTLDDLRTFAGLSAASRPDDPVKDVQPVRPPANTASTFAPATGGAVWASPAVIVEESTYPERVRDLNSQLRSLEKRFLAESERSGRTLIPAPIPLVQGGLVIYRGPNKVKAVRARDGSVAWASVLVDFTFKELAEKNEFLEGDELIRELFLGQRAWRDATSAALSADNRFVYTVMNCGMVGAVDAGMLMLSGRHAKGPFRDNTLQAYRLQGGKQQWVIGGPRNQREDEFAGLYFLGAPLPWQGLIYCLVEDRGQVRLLVLDPTPENRPTIVWSQALLNPSPDMTIEYHNGRRTANLTPVASGDLVICPTGAGTIVAVDAQQRRLVWATEYSQPEFLDPRERMLRNAMRQRQNNVQRQRQALDGLLDEPRWRSGPPLLAGEYLLLTTPDSHTLLCLRQSDGSIAWELPVDHRLYLAGVVENRVIVVGEGHVEAFDLATGQPAWGEPTPISRPSGRGLLNGPLYTLPLASEELATIDLRDGRLLVRTPLPSGMLPGNLVAAEGRLVWQSAQGLTAFSSQDEIAPELAALAGDDVTAQRLALRGEQHLHAGNVEAGLSDLRRSLELEDSLRTRRVLISALLDGLRVDFSGSLAVATELDRLVSGTSDELPFRRLYASGLQQRGDRVEAFEQYLRLGGLIRPGADLENVDASLAVSPDRWIEARMRELLQSSPDVDRVRMQAIASEHLAAAAQGRTEADYRRLVSLARLTRGTDLEEAARLELARNSQSASELWQEWLWLPFLKSERESVRAEAAARLAQIYLAMANTWALAPILQQLETEFADTPCYDGRTGRELTTTWRADPRYALTIAGAMVQSLPTDPISVTLRESSGPLDRSRPVPVIGRVDGPLQDWSFRYDDRQQSLRAYAPTGRFGWEVRVGPASQNEQLALQGIMIRGHLVMLIIEDRFDLVNALDATGGSLRTRAGGQRLLADLNDFDSPRQLMGRMDGRSGALGLAGPLTSTLICFQRGVELIALDPWTNQTAWKRRLVEPAAAIVADDEYTVLLPRRRTAALSVLSGIDGQLLNQPAPPTETVSAPAGVAWGRLIFRVHKTDATTQFRMFDPVLNQAVWEHELPSPVLWSIVDGGDFAVVDGNGAFHLLRYTDGRELLKVDLPVDFEAPRDSLTVVTDSQRIYLALNQPQNSQVLRFDRTSAISGERPVNGRLFAIHRAAGAVAWTRDVAGYFIDPAHPTGWPFLMLAAQQKPAEADVMGRAFLVLSKETGEPLHDSHQAIKGSTTSRLTSGWKVDAERGVVQLQYGSDLLEIQCGPVVTP